MMKLTSEEVLKIASLARLEPSPAEVEKLQAQLSGILNYIETLNTYRGVKALLYSGWFIAAFPSLFAVFFPSRASAEIGNSLGLSRSIGG